MVQKAQRNDPCPCGSGKKYKKCCMLEERNLSAVRAGNREVVQDAVNWITQRHGDALARWVEHVWFDGTDAQQRKGISTADPSIKHIHDTNLLEYMMAEGVFAGENEDAAEMPAMQLVLDSATHLTDTQREYLQQLGEQPLRLYQVSECAPGESFTLKPVKDGKGKDVCIEDKWISRMLDVGDTVGLRLVQTGGEWETSGAVYHIPDEYVFDLQARLDEADTAAYSPTLIRFWLELVAAHV